MEIVYDDAGGGVSRNRWRLNEQAIAIVTGVALGKVEADLRAVKWDWVSETASSARLAWADHDGFPKEVYRKYMDMLGWERHTTMKVGKGVKTHVNENELPATCLVQVSADQLLAVVERKLHDSFPWDRSREGTRAVYSWWTQR